MTRIQPLEDLGKGCHRWKEQLTQRRNSRRELREPEWQEEAREAGGGTCSGLGPVTGEQLQADSRAVFLKQR